MAARTRLDVKAKGAGDSAALATEPDLTEERRRQAHARRCRQIVAEELAALEGEPDAEPLDPYRGAEAFGRHAHGSLDALQRYALDDDDDDSNQAE